VQEGTFGNEGPFPNWEIYEKGIAEIEGGFSESNKHEKPLRPRDGEGGRFTYNVEKS
jgi:hypothetical protein